MKDTAIVHPCARLEGALSVPGDKSISHRVVMVSAIAEGTSIVRGFLDSEDCCNTLQAVARLGAGVRRKAGQIEICGTGGRLVQPQGQLDLGNAGTGMRLLAGLLAGQPFRTEMTGDASLRSRPMRRIKEPLERMGARVELLGPGGRAPMVVSGGHLHGIEYPLPVASAQVKSCVLLAGMFAAGPTTVIEPRPTRDHTERLLGQGGVAVTVDGPRIRIEGYGPGMPPLKATSWQVPGDFSSAAFWLTAAACLPGSRVVVTSVGLNPRRTAFLDVLRAMGAEVAVSCRSETGVGEPRGDITVEGRGLRGVTVGGEIVPNLIDELPLVAVAGVMAEGDTVIRDAAELRVKESDRIANMCANLSAMGVRVEERDDGLEVRGPNRLRGGQVVGSRGDHRVAMALAVLGLMAGEPVHVEDVACIATSYPGFWADLEKLGGHAEVHHCH